MTVFCQPMDGSFVFSQIRYGASETANLIEAQVRETLLHYGEPRLRLLLADIEQIALDANAGNELIKVDRNTLQAAIDFAGTLPRALPPPEVSLDPDSEIAFDWLGRSGKIFSVSINAEGRLAYAGWFGEKSKVHGVEQLSEICSPEITRGIAKAFR